jgi:hypothetical protein
LTLVEAVPASASLRPGEVPPAQIASDVTGCAAVITEQLAPGPVATHVSPSVVKPLAPERFALHFTIGRETHGQSRNDHH